jgi:hypothetical protein
VEIAWNKFSGQSFDFEFVQRRPSEVVQKRIFNEIRQMVSKQLALEYGVFYALYIQIEQIAGAKHDHATRKSPGHILWVRALVLI